MSATTLERNITLLINGGARREVYCTCGEFEENLPGYLLTNDRVTNCKKCGAKVEHVCDVKPTAKKIKMAPTLEVISKDARHFHIKKTTNYLLLDFDATVKKVIAKSGKTFELKFDFRSRELIMLRNGKEIPCDPDASNYAVFTRGMTQEELVSLISVEETKHLFTFILNEYGKEYRETQALFCRGLLRHLRKDKNSIAEKLAFAGFGRFIQPLHKRQTWSFLSYETIQQAFDIEKRHFPYYKKLEEYADRYVSKRFIAADEKVSWNNMKVFYDYGLDYNSMDDLLLASETFAELVKDYGYNPKRLTEYANRELRLLQGINDIRGALNILYDYNRFMRKLDLEPEKYPKSLKREHDLAAANVAAIELRENGSNFTAAVTEPEYKELAFKGKEYSIILPQAPKDLSDEGTYLTHCVAGYISDVIKKYCKIVFLRHNSALDISLVTVEVRGENVVQASGFDNRKLRTKEMEFLREWAENKKLKVLF